jgi:tripartite-type tricarboxylate transporter receptor subunit TctC
MLANLSPDERAKLRAAHQQAMADPAVQAARDRQRQAAREFRELKRQRMLQADPTIQPILDKMPARGPRGR